MCQMWILEKLNFKISRGSIPPDPSSVPTPLALDPILVGSTLYCFRRACNCMQLTVWKTIIWIYPLLYWNFWNKYQFAAKYMQFHRNFRLIFSLHLSKNAQMCTLEKLNFKISRGSIPPDPPSLLAPSALDTIWPGLTLNCFRRACYFQSVTLTMILRILRTQKDVYFLSRKGCTSRIVQRYIF